MTSIIHNIGFTTIINNELTSNPVYKCTSQIIFEDNQLYIIQKNITQPVDISIVITYVKINNENIFAKGFIYYNKTHEICDIISYNLYSSLQIGELCYDTIGICKLTYLL